MKTALTESGNDMDLAEFAHLDGFSLLLGAEDLAHLIARHQHQECSAMFDGDELERMEAEAQDQLDRIDGGVLDFAQAVVDAQGEETARRLGFA
ncbi:hypothetical protein [Saccharothrix sp. HUAS TT1]|uniref:hypothetical protein n=1 Tax=unclassified Saccharothrix TaxID=2593673 RepID=UPI00345C5684